MNKVILDDLYRVTGKRDKAALRNCRRRNDGFRFMYYWRMMKASGGIKRKIYQRIVRCISRRTGVEIPESVEIGSGILLLHPAAITINSKARIGRNCVLLKGCTIGNQKRGKRMGAPVIGDDVYIGLNSSVVGGITIGDDVLIAPNTYVNFDVPAHSVVIGSPGIIHPRPNATEGYIGNRV